MMLLGSFIIWAVFIWIFQKYFLMFIRQIHSNDVQRIKNLQERLHQNFIFREKDKIQKITRWVFLIGTIISFLMKSIFIFIVIIIFYIFFPTAWIQWAEYQRKKMFQKQLLILLPSLSSMLRSGHGLERAFGELKKNMQPPISEEIHLMLKQIQLGTPLDGALQKMAERFPSDNFLMFVHAVVIARKLGTSLSESVDHISQNIMEKEKLRQQISTLTSQGKMQSYIAVVMPFFIGIAITMISPNYFDPLFFTLIGKCSLIYCGISMMTGLLWIYKITHKEYL